MQLGFGLVDLQGLKKLDCVFLEFLFECDGALHSRLLSFRSCPAQVLDKHYSEFLLDISPLFDDFLAELFNIEHLVSQIRRQHKEFDIIYDCKRKFVQRYAIKKYPLSKINEIDFKNISSWLEEVLGGRIIPEKFSKQIMQWRLDEEKFALELEKAAQYASYMVHKYSDDILFKVPQNVDKNHLINEQKISQYKKNLRTDFNHCDMVSDAETAMDQAHYCIYCHKQTKDSCSKGHQLNPALLVTGNNGCPLKQKISEMNYVKARGFNLAALAIIVIDNPMVAATGHRICNDCSNSCIYQKQDPVDIPYIESNILESVLSLPYGLEIYLLLTRWNPLNIRSPLPSESSNYNVLVTGLGLAGFSLSHYLLKEGHNVIAIDGLKITPLPFDVAKPIKYWSQYKEKLSERVPQGFGGVMEYGITPRWDKNNLTILRLILERNNNFKYFSGVRLGSNITISQAFNLGFDHVAFCHGASQPKLVKMDNFLAKGVRTASDFLMNLQSVGAFLKKSTTNMLIRMPVAIIGGGLTSIDVATEILYYYRLQVEKFLNNYESRENSVENLNEEDKSIAEEFLQHAKLFKQTNGDGGKIRRIFDDLGGVTIYYRGALQNSPAYKLNHVELMHAMAAGVKFVENMQPLAIHVNEYNYAESIEFDCLGERKNMKARTVIMSVGTETGGNFFVEEFKDRSSYFGDLDPSYSGSVVKSLASSKNDYQAICSKLAKNKPTFNSDYLKFFEQLDHLLNSYVKASRHLSDRIMEVVIHSPLAAKNFRPGQFFRLQNYSSDVTKLMEPLALTGVYANPDEGLIHFIILKRGKSSSLCEYLLPGEKVVLMGPTGAATEILKGKNVVLIGEEIGNAGLLAIGQALQNNNCKIIYFADYKTAQDRFYQERIEEMSKIVVWSCEDGVLSKSRTRDVSIQGNIIDAIKFAAAQKFLHKIDRIVCIGSANVMQEVKNIKNDYFGVDAKLIVSVNSPMQCMMQGVCGQCVQKTINNNYIFSCICQDQDASTIDFLNLQSRLEQNSLLEKLVIA